MKKHRDTTIHVNISRERDRRLDKLVDAGFDKKHGIDTRNQIPAYLFVPIDQWEMTPKLKNHLSANRRIGTLNDLRIYNLSDIENQPEQDHGKTKFTDEMRSELKEFVSNNGGWFFEDHEDKRTVEIQMTKGEVLTDQRRGIAKNLLPAPQPS